MEKTVSAKRRPGSRQPRPGKRILFLGDFAYSSAKAVASGAVRELSGHPDVALLFHGAHPGDNDGEYAFEADVDGIITCGGIAGKFARRLAAAGNRCPIVFVSQACDLPGVARRSISLVFDDAAISCAAAGMFVRHDMVSFGFVGSRLDKARAGWDAERRESYVRALAGTGREAIIYEPPPRRRGSVADFDALAKWLRALPKPCGLFVSYDQRAMGVLNVCRAEGIAVPEQIQVVGVDNEAWICENTSPTLTSIEPDFEGAGSRAVEELLKMIGGAPGGFTVKFGVRRIVQRMSTTDSHGSASRAVRARDWLRTHVGEAVSLAGLAKALNCSTRTLETSYKTVFGTTAQEDVVAMRIERAREILEGTKTPIGEIPELLGFSSPVHFARLFKARTGMSMRECRRRARPADRQRLPLAITAPRGIQRAAAGDGMVSPGR